MKLLKFEKEHCPSCEKVDAFLLQYENIQLHRMNPFENPKVAVSYNIASVPVIILLDDDEVEIQRCIGYKPEELKILIENYG